MHTYRDSFNLRRRAFATAYAATGVLIVVLLSAVTHPLWASLVLSALIAFVQYITYRNLYEAACTEIRLSDEGICELQAKRRMIRLDATQVRSVNYTPESDQTNEHYTLSYQGGNLRVGRRMTGFPDFLARLKALNPALDLTSLPAQFWAQGRTPAAHEPARELINVIRSAATPLIITVALALIATQTLLGR
jgi:hypothetical protein